MGIVGEREGSPTYMKTYAVLQYYITLYDYHID